MALLKRQSSHEVRLEMMPLLDVIFLLLTFFIFSQAVLIRAHVLPVDLPGITSGETTEAARVAGITVDRHGAIYLNAQPVPMAALAGRLEELASQAEPPQVFLAIEDAPGKTDRGPLVVKLMEMLRSAGIEQFSIVGRPTDNTDE